MFLLAWCGIALAASAAWAAPVVTTLSPANGAEWVHPLAPVSITFDSAVEAGHARLLELRRKADSHVLSTVAAASSFVSIEGATATVAFPSRQVVSGAVYVTIEAGAFVSKADQSAFAGVTAQSWSFELQGEASLAMRSSRMPRSSWLVGSRAPVCWMGYGMLRPAASDKQAAGGGGGKGEGKAACARHSWRCALCLFSLHSQRGSAVRRWCGARTSPKPRVASTP